MINFGAVPSGAVLPVIFDAFDGGTGASITLTGLAVTDVEIYKGISMTQRASDAGVALIDTDGIDLDTITGIHGFSIDTGDNTDAGFYAVGSFFTVVVSSVTIDAQTVNFVAATFRIVAAEGITGTPKADVAAWLGTAAATPTVAGVPEVDLTHVAGATTNVAALATNIDAILTDTGTTLQAEVDAIQAAVITNAAGTDIAADIIALKAETAAILTDTGTTLDGRIPAALVGGRMDASVGAVAANAITAAAIADGAIDRATFAADTGLQSIRSNTAQTGAATSITLDASASAVTDFYKNALIIITGGTGVGQGRFCTAYNGTTKVATVAAWATAPDVTSTFAIMAFDAIVGATAPTAAEVADAVWDENIGDHAIASSTGETLQLTLLIASDAAAIVGATLGTPAGLSVSADIAAIKADTAAILVDTGTTLDAALAVVDANVDAILVDTAEIGTAGAGLTNINLPNQTMDIVGNITGNLSGSVGSLTTNNDKTGYALSAAAVQAIWDALTAALTTVGSIGKKLADWTIGTAQTGDSFARIGAAGAGLTAVPWNAAWDAEVESEVNDAIDTAIAELGVAAPTATPTLRTGMMLMYMALRNKLVVQTSGTDAIELYNDAGTKIASKAITDDGSDYTEAEMA